MQGHSNDDSLTRDDVAPEPNERISAQLKTFLAEFEGTQRELLALLDTDWIPRLMEHDGSVRAIAAASIRGKIKSRKLVAEVEARVEKLFR